MSKGQRLRRLQQAVRSSPQKDSTSGDSDASKEDDAKESSLSGSPTPYTTAFYFKTGKQEKAHVNKKQIRGRKILASSAPTSPPSAPMTPLSSPERASSEQNVPLRLALDASLPKANITCYDNQRSGWFYKLDVGDAVRMGWRRSQDVPLDYTSLPEHFLGSDIEEEAETTSSSSSGVSSLGSAASSPLISVSVSPVMLIGRMGADSGNCELEDWEWREILHKGSRSCFGQKQVAQWDDAGEFPWLSSWDRPLSGVPSPEEEALAERIRQVEHLWQ